MESPTPFQELIRRLRSGDASAATELVQTYEKEIRRTIRIRMTDPRLRRTLDSMDICQSVMANFFVRASAGQFDLDQPEQLLHLLMKMAKNKIIDKARMEQARGRDRRQEQSDGSDMLAGVSDQRESPSQIASGKELLETARQLLSEEERYLADQRSLGRNWAELAAELNKSPEAIRKQLERALDRVANMLGLDATGTNE